MTPSVSRVSAAGRAALIALVLGYLSVLVLAPVAAIVKGAFAFGAGAFFRETFQPDVLRAFRFTLLLALVAVAANTVAGVVVAWVLVRHEFPGKRFLNALVDLPFAVSPVVAAYMLILLFGRSGWFAGILERTGLRVVFAWPGMMLATVFVTLPFVVREVMPVLQEFGPEQEEAAATLGADRWQTFWRVTLPSVRWGLLFGAALTFARAIGEFGAVYVVSGAVAGLTETATLFVFRAMDERMYTATFGVSLLLAVLSSAFLAVVEAYRAREERRLTRAAPERVAEGA